MDDEGMTIELLVKITIDTWEHVIAEHGKRAQWVPKLVLVDDAGRMDVVALIIDVPEGEEVDTAAAMLDTVGRMVQPSTAWLAVTMDAYVCNDERFNQRVAEGQTTLAQLYAQGMPGVVDCLFLHACDRQGRMTHRNLPYRVRGHRVHWLPSVGFSDDVLSKMGGRVVDGLRAAMTRAGN